MTTPKKLRVGLIGCGGIAQMMHLPFLAKNASRFELAALCDLSPGVLNAMGERYRVPTEMRFTHHADLSRQNLDVVIITSGGDHFPQAAGALSAGKHVLVEKPLCYTQAEAVELGRLAREKGLTLMVAYMKRYDPGYLYARRLLAGMQDLQYVQMNTLHPEEDDYLAIHGIVTASDVPAEQLRAIQAEDRRRVVEAVGEIDPVLQSKYTDVFLGSMVHDVNTMRGLLGEPERVLFAESWPAGGNPGSTTAVIAYPGDLRVVYTWSFLGKLRNYFQEIAIMSPAQRLRIQFPSPYLDHFPTPVLYEEMDGTAQTEKRIFASYDEAFERELLAFYDHVVLGTQPQTDAEDARRDIHILQEILAALRPAGLGGEASQAGPGKERSIH